MYLYVNCKLMEFDMAMIFQVVESSSALILQLKSEDLKAAWQYYLALATYKSSVSSRMLRIVFVGVP
jgi:hypothetical protein